MKTVDEIRSGKKKRTRYINGDIINVALLRKTPPNSPTQSKSFAHPIHSVSSSLAIVLLYRRKPHTIVRREEYEKKIKPVTREEK